jgi:formate/nitrite transporter FocA (FNT family)
MHDGEPTDQVDGSSDVSLSGAERQQVQERARPRAAVLYETIRTEGELELHRPASALAWSGLAAGLSMGFSLVATGLIRAGLPDMPWRPLVSSLGYAVGFLIVIKARQQLFTENTLTAVLPFLQRHNLHGFWLLVRLWSIVLATNLVGVLLFALLAGHTDAFSSEAKREFTAFGLEALEGGFGSHFVRAIVSGWLIALVVWMLPGAGATSGAIIVVLTYLIGLGRLSHVVAGSVDVLYVVTTGAAAWADFVLRFFVPVLLGNIAGGGALVAALSHAQISADEETRGR